MIRFVEKIKEETGRATVKHGDEIIEAKYHKCPETGDVEIAVDGDLDEDENFIKPASAVTITLHKHDGGPDSDYSGVIGDEGLFQS